MGVAFGALAALPLAAHAQGAGDGGAAQDQRAEIDALRDEVRQLSAEVADLKRTQDEQIQTLGVQPAAQAPAAPSAFASIVNGKPSIASADGRFTANLHGILQLDTAQYDQASPGPLSTDTRRDGNAVGSPSVDMLHARDLKDGDVFRRARIGVDGKAFGDFDYRLIFDFAGAGVEDSGQLYEGWLQYSGLNPFHLRVGAFRPSSGLEDQTTPTMLPFLERPTSTDTAVSIAASDTRIGAQAFAYASRWFVSGALTGRTIGVLSTGTASPTAQTYGDPLGVVGRAAGVPLQGGDWSVHLGVHGSYVIHPADTTGPSLASGATPITAYTIALNDTPELRVDGAKLINTGSIDARHADNAGAEIAIQKKNFFLQSEFEHIDVQRSDINSTPSFNGWYVEGTWIITGEARAFNPSTAAFDGPSVAHPFSLANHAWGAWELGLRYSDMDLNYHAGLPGAPPAPDAIRGGDQRIFTAGVNWYLNPMVRFMFDYQRVSIGRLSPCTTAATMSCATVWETKPGAQIGQDYNAWAIRSQFAF